MEFKLASRLNTGKFWWISECKLRIFFSFHCPIGSNQDSSRALYEDKLDKMVKYVPWYQNWSTLSLLGLLVLAAGKVSKTSFKKVNSL